VFCCGCRKGKIPALTPKEEQRASEVFDSPIEERGLSVIENVGSYEVKKSIFGKDKVVKVK